MFIFPLNWASFSMFGSCLDIGFACPKYPKVLGVPPPPSPGGRYPFPVIMNHGITNGGATLLFEHGNKTIIVYFKERFSL